MALDSNLQYIISTALQVGDFDTALPWLETFSTDQISQLVFSDQRTPLHYACQHGRVDVAQQLITNCQCSIESKDVQGCTPLHTAAQYGQVETLKYLLHRLFNHEVSGLTIKLMSGGQLSRTLTGMFQQKLSEQHRDQSGNTPLHTACIHGQLDIVQLLSHEIGCDPNKPNFGGLSCLHLATLHGGRLDVVRYLVDTHHCDPLCPDEQKVTPLHTAAAEGKLEIVRYFAIAHQCNLLVKNNFGDSPLHRAARSGHLGVVKFLTEDMKCNPNLKGQFETMPLHHASESGHLDVVRYLVDTHHCDPLCPDENKVTPLHIAAANGKLEVVRYFAITHQCNLIVKNNFGDTPLHRAALSGHLGVVKFLTEDMKCDPNLKGQYQRTLLHKASARGHLDVVRYLVDTHHCDPLCPDEDKSTPLHRAAREGQLEVVRYFAITRQCNLLVKNNFGNTPLHRAALSGHLGVVKFLTEDMKCNPNLKGQFETIPLHGASERGHLDVVRYLVDTHHCDPLCPGEDKETSLHRAAAEGKLEVVRYFAITRQCNLLVKANFGVTPHHAAARSGHLGVVKFLTEDMKCNPNLKGQFERMSLHGASARGHLDVVRYLVDTHHCDPLCPDEGKETPLHWAAAEGKLEVVRYFAITRQCNLLVKNNFGDTPLHRAALSGHLGVVKFLTEDMKCNPNLKGQFERMPLHSASARGHLDVVRYLVDTHHCDPLCPDEGKETPLHRAAREGQLEVVRYFAITRQCNLLVKNNFGNTPLHHAALGGHLGVVKFLTEDMKCNPNLKGQLERMPLHHASESGHLDVVRYLVDTHHCDPLCPDEQRITPLYLAISISSLMIVKYFAEDCRLDPYLQIDRKKLLNAAKKSALLDFLEAYVDPLHHAAMTGDIESVRDCVERKKWCLKMLDRHGNNALHNAAKYGQLEVVKYLTGFFATPESAYPSVLCDPQTKNKRGLTAQSIASQSGYQHVVSYLLRATNQTVSERYAISPTINIFVLGNSGSGKSTLVKALSTENGVFGKLVKVRGVIPLTAGIVPTALHSQVFGRVNIYDFAGHEEYYASHEMILQHTPQALVLLTLDVSAPLLDIEKALNYWLFLLSNDCFKAFHVLAIGSHADKVKTEEMNFIRKKVNAIISEVSAVSYHGFIHCDCRYSGSDSLKQIRQNLDTICRSIRLYLTHQESDYSNRLCASLMHHLQQNRSDQVTITVSGLHEQIKCLKSPGPTLVQLVDLKLLLQTCSRLNSAGHLLFFQHDKRSILVLDEKVILSKIHACLAAVKSELDNSIGMLEEKKLGAILSSSMKKLLPPDLAIKYLLFAQFCTEVSADKLISMPGEGVRQKQYFFPNLVLASRPSSIFCAVSDVSQYSHFFTWCLKCSNIRQFFTPRFIHTLFIQLVKCERDTVNTAYTIWKNGISFCHGNGTRYIIEVTDQTTRVYLAIQCVKGCESHLVKQRSMLISLIKSLVHKTCPTVAVEEVLLPPQTTYPPDKGIEIPVAKVECSIKSGHRYVAYKSPGGDVPQQVLVEDLLYFDFLSVSKSLLHDMFTQIQSSSGRASLSALINCSGFKLGQKLADILEDMSYQGVRELTYRNLHDNLTEYSVFTDWNLVRP